MKRFHSILVVTPHDVSPTEAIATADRLATMNGGRLHIFDTTPPLRASRSGFIGRYRASDIEDMVASARRSELEQAVADCRAPVEVEVGSGPLFIEAIKRVLRDGHDLLLVAPDQEAGSHGLSRASTTMHLLRKCPVPVWVHRSDLEERHDVMAAVGPFAGGEATDLDRLILQLGSSMAERRGGRLHVVHAWGVPGESFLRSGRAKLPRSEVDELLNEERTLAQLEVEKLLVDTGLYNDQVSVHLEPGNPADAITEATARLRPDVVVMGTLARSGIAGLLIGNTAENVLSAIDASVLTVKPADFVTPVTI